MPRVGTDATVVGDLVARERRTERPFLWGDGRHAYSHHQFCTDAWKAANLFRYNGAGPGRPVAIADDLGYYPLVAFVGAALLGARARFGPVEAGEARLRVADAETIASLADEPGVKRVAYGGSVDDPAVVAFERDSWSENPVMPPESVAPDAVALEADDDEFTHAALLDATGAVIDEQGLTAEDDVAVRASLAIPGVIVAGLLAPLAAGAQILLPGADETGTLAVTSDDAPEPRTLDPTAVL